MRILQVSSAKNFGGGEKHLVDLVNGLTRRGHELFLAAPKDAAVTERLEKVALPPENIFPVGVRGALDISAARQLAALIKKHDIDVIHAHLARDYFPVSLAARFAPAVKFVLTRHVLFRMKTLHRFALANVARVIAVSGAVERQLLEQRVFAPDKVARIPNGIDVERWGGPRGDGPRAELRRKFRAAHNIPENAALIGTVGELKKLKGQEDFILAAEVILQRFPESYFILAGKDNSADGAYKKHLRELVTAIDAADRFVWLDWTDDTAPLLHALDVFVSASHSESFGLAILEAMASGCAIVSTATEGAKELLGDKNLVPVEDPLKLATTIMSFLDDEPKRIEEGKINREIAGKNFDIAEMIEATEELYRGL